MPSPSIRRDPDARHAAVERQSTAPATIPTEGDLRRMRLTLAVSGWAGGGATLYGAAQGCFLALVRAGEADLAQMLHDAAGRKCFALSPLRVCAGAGHADLVTAELDVALWDTHLAEAFHRGCSVALDESLQVAGHAAAVLDCRVVEQTTFAHLLESRSPSAAVPVGTRPTPHMYSGPLNPAPAAIRVRFVTPTVFSWGRGLNGQHRYCLLPAPELVVGSWLRAWNAAGGPCLPLRGEPAWLRDRVAVRSITSLRTVTVHTGKTPLSGFVGELVLEWCGAEPGAHRALRVLADFARFCGTGAKTAYGLGCTALA